MMDAGTAFFKAKEGYGSILGQIKAEMEVYGKVFKATDFDIKDLPFSTKECDLFLDFSTFWRNRYISCRLEDAGETGESTKDKETVRKYAASFKEGNTDTKFRGGVYACLIILFVLSSILGFAIHFVAGLLCLAAAFYLGCNWIAPSVKSQKTVKNLKNKIESYFENLAGTGF